MKLEKITKNPDTRQRRRYEDACAAAHAMDLLGERWALLVVRELMWGPRRFSDLRSALPGLSANVLTQRLEGLEAAINRRWNQLDWGWCQFHGESDMIVIVHDAWLRDQIG